MTTESECTTYQGCTLLPDEGCGDACILHYDSADKDAVLFQERLEAKIKHDESDLNMGEIDLKFVVFPVDASFTDKVFTKRASFTGAQFHGWASFTGVQFNCRANFLRTKFSGEADFSNVIFQGASDFSAAEFYSVADFTFVQFQGTARFERLEFYSVAHFWGAEFHDGANFVITQFHGVVDFTTAKFLSEANFRIAKINSEANFTDAEFHEETNFTGTTIEGTMRFHSTEFPNEGSDSRVLMQRLRLSNLQGLDFESVNLSRVSFLGTDVTQARFLSCDWATRAHPIFWPIPILQWFGKRKRVVVFDELMLDEREKEGHEPERRDILLIAEVCRRLRVNFEASRQEIEAGDFFIGQMDMRQRDPKASNFTKGPLFLYRVIAIYGEAYFRPFLWYLLLAPLFAVGYWWLSTATFGDGVFAALTAGRLFTEIPTGIESWEKLLVYVNMLANILFITVFVVALRRRFHR
ncbi:MAG: pentapeptide repeat-containing protein [Chloroflexi bacterium]|nr:pentapeptide repeat-containing protein [Chloroflexota bacterium]